MLRHDVSHTLLMARVPQPPLEQALRGSPLNMFKLPSTYGKNFHKIKPFSVDPPLRRMKTYAKHRLATRLTRQLLQLGMRDGVTTTRSWLGARGEKAF